MTPPDRPIHVLLVEDEDDYRRVLARRLRKRGLVVDELGSAEVALDWLADHADDVDVVVLDVRLPGMTGVQALERIKQRFADLEVLILTGYADTETAVRVMELGAFDYLMKPASLQDLVVRIEHAFRRRQLRDDAR